MYRALAIPEIVHIILDFLLVKPSDDLSANKVCYEAAKAMRSSMLNVALTCRSFSEPALDILWWTMGDLVPLFNLLPGFQDNQKIHFPISAHALEVFDRFANRIRFYCMINTAKDRVNMVSYVKVLQTFGRFHLLPRLQFIYTERNEPQLLFLGSPRLRTFRTSSKLTGGIDDDHVQSFLDFLPTTSPEASALYLEFPLQERSLLAIGRMPALKSLIMTVEDTRCPLPLGPDFLTRFASRQTINWYMKGNISVALPPVSGFSVLDFKGLVCLSLDPTIETSIAEYSTLFRVGNFPSLQSIIIRFRVARASTQGPLPNAMWRNFFTHLHSKTRNLLSTMEVNFIVGRPVSHVSFEDLPELRTSTLTTFSQRNLFHSLSAANISAMCTWWPGLTCLQLCVEQVTIGFSSLVEIASRLHFLEFLDMQLNCTTFSTTMPGVPILQHNLKILRLDLRHLEHHVIFASFLDCIFPNIVSLTISGTPPFLKPEVGKEIQAIYQGHQAAKKFQKVREMFYNMTRFPRPLA